tara:strand:- start:1240 stop:1530 length:291 start_codon:yes stop_codon:yes gene_type:complete
MEIHNFNLMGSTDFMSMKRVWESYHNVVWASEDILEIGFNENLKYVYIALENGIKIASSYGLSVEYIVTNNENGKEDFYNSYTEAKNKIEKLHERV